MKTTSPFLSLVLVILLSVLLTTNRAFSQEDKSLKNLKNAIALHFEATSTHQELVAAQTLKHLSDLHPDDWRTAYWAAFVYTQAGRKMEAPLPYYDTAQILLDKAVAVNTSVTKNETSEYHVLQSLIYTLKTSPYWSKGDEDTAMKFTNLMLEERQKAAFANPNNPRLYLLMGTGYVGEGKRRKDPTLVLAGKAMLEEANRKFEEFPPENSVAPSWGKGWINFWLANIGDLATLSK